MIWSRSCASLPAGHGVVSEEHLLAQLTVLDPARELHVSELISQQLWPQEALEGQTQQEHTLLKIEIQATKPHAKNHIHLLPLIHSISLLFLKLKCRDFLLVFPQ